MRGRFIQLGRQLRKLRHIVGGSPSATPVTTLRRATQLACDLACEHAGVGDAQAGFHDLAVRGIVEPALAERLAARVASQAAGESAATLQRDDTAGALSIGRDLDTFLRSLELGAPAPELPFEAIVTREPADGAARPDSTAGVPVSGRILALEVRGGLAMIAVDAQPIQIRLASGEQVASFALATAPTSTPEIHCERTGVTRVVWESENLAIELAPDFQGALVSRS